MTFNAGRWSSIPQEKFPKEFERVKRRDESLPPRETMKCEHFESIMFEKGVEVDDPRYLETDDILVMLTSYFSKYTLHVKHDKRFQGVIDAYCMELGKLLQEWSDEALMAVAERYQTVVYPPDRLFELFKKCQNMHLQYQNHLTKHKERTQ